MRLKSNNDRPLDHPHPVFGLGGSVPNELRSRTVQREWLLVAAGGTGEQVIVVLDGTRDEPGASVWRPPSSSAGPAGQAAAVTAVLPVRTWLIRDSHDATSDGFLDAVDVLRVRHPVRIYSEGL
jgi:hypothetical protein